MVERKRGRWARKYLSRVEVAVVRSRCDGGKGRCKAPSEYVSTPMRSYGNEMVMLLTIFRRTISFQTSNVSDSTDYKAFPSFLRVHYSCASFVMVYPMVRSRSCNAGKSERVKDNRIPAASRIRTFATQTPVKAIRTEYLAWSGLDVGRLGVGGSGFTKTICRSLWRLHDLLSGRGIRKGSFSTITAAHQSAVLIYLRPYTSQSPGTWLPAHTLGNPSRNNSTLEL